MPGSPAQNHQKGFFKIRPAFRKIEPTFDSFLFALAGLGFCSACLGDGDGEGDGETSTLGDGLASAFTLAGGLAERIAKSEAPTINASTIIETRMAALADFRPFVSGTAILGKLCSFPLAATLLAGPSGIPPSTRDASAGLITVRSPEPEEAARFSRRREMSITSRPEGD
jgi:hypothetical protein